MRGSVLKGEEGIHLKDVHLNDVYVKEEWEEGVHLLKQSEGQSITGQQRT